MALSNHNICLIKSYDKCTILYSDVLTLSFMYRLIRKNNDNFKRSLNFYNKLFELVILIHYFKEEKG